jgi:ABC-type nitrate/sulfonate/bicarbonate transport system substrate-binding protein
MAGVKLARPALVVALLCGLFSLACANFIFAAAAVRVGYPQPSGAMLPIWVMSEAKLAQKYGIELQSIYISGGARLTQTLVSGDIDIAATGGAVINAVLSGAEMTYIAAGVPTYGFSLYARADVKDVP